MGPYYWDTDSPGGTGAWRGVGGWVGDPDRMRRDAMLILGYFDAGLCPCCGHRLDAAASPGWVRCRTSYSSGPRTTGTDPIEYQIRPGDAGRPLWYVRSVPADVQVLFVRAWLADLPADAPLHINRPRGPWDPRQLQGPDAAA